MAYVVARKSGRFEIRESILTERGPRARSLANFSTLSEAVLQRAQERATRPFDRDAVTASAIRRGVAVSDSISSATALDLPSMSMERFAQGARRFALAADEAPRRSSASDPGDVLIELLHFADEVRRHQPSRAPERLCYPVVKALASSVDQG